MTKLGGNENLGAHLKLIIMAFQVKFSQKVLYSLLNEPILEDGVPKTANAVLFQPVFNLKREIINIEAWAVFHNSSNNKQTIKIGTKGKAKYINTLPVPSNTGTLGVVKPPIVYNDLDNIFNAIRQGTYEQDANNPTITYDLVLLMESQIPHVFKDTSYAEGKTGSADSHLKLEHIYIDFGSIIGNGVHQCRSSINLIAKSDPHIFKALPVGDSFQFGHPCPPDWWYNPGVLLP